MEKVRPKVIVFTTAYHPFIGGAEIAIQETVRRLRDTFEFYVITHRIRRVLPQKEIFEGATVIRLGFGTKLDRFFLFPFLAGFRALRLLEGPTLLWGVMVSYASIGAYFAKLLRPHVPFVLTLQEGDSESHLISGKLGLIGMWWKALLKSADKVTVISTYLRAFAKQRSYRGETILIPNGVDIEKFKVQSEKLKVKGGRIIITTSRLVDKNGVDILIRAIAEVRKKISGIRCHIIGDGEERESLETLVGELGLQREVKFFGSVPHEQIPLYLRDADVFVRASRSEGMGNSFIEALAADLPIIGTAVGGIPDIIEDGKTGLFTGVDDPNDLAEKIVRLLTDVDLADTIVREGQRKIAGRFEWHIIAQQYKDVFEHLL